MRPSLSILLCAALLVPAARADRPQAMGSQRVDQRVPVKPIGRVQLVKAEKPEESVPAYGAVRKGQTEVRPTVSAGTSGIKKKRLVALELD